MAKKPDPNQLNRKDHGTNTSPVGNRSSIIGAIGRAAGKYVVGPAAAKAAKAAERTAPVRGVRKVQRGVNNVKRTASMIRNLRKGDCICGGRLKPDATYCSPVCAGNDPEFDS